MKIWKKSYLRMEIELVSSLSIGSGENGNTDHDILVDAQGHPYIPGSAIAGVTLHALKDTGLLVGDEVRDVFGYVGGNGSEEQADSRIITYDAILTSPDERHPIVVSNRDMVSLDEYKTAKAGAKFDMEVLEPGATAVVIIEQNLLAQDDRDILVDIARVWNAGVIRLGAKTVRGYGAVKIREIPNEDKKTLRKAVYLRDFTFTDGTQITNWLNFDPQKESNWIKAEDVWGQPDGEKWKAFESTISNGTQIALTLQQEGGISIRRYTTTPSQKHDGKTIKAEPDYSQMTYRNGNPVIPGTSWAGAFRHAISEFVDPKHQDRGAKGNKDPEIVRKYFGVVDGRIKRKSYIYFSESEIKNATPKEFTRNAINRFTGGTKDGALYTERTYYNGKDIGLTITIHKNHEATAEQEQRFMRALTAALVDLHEGFLAVGGETSIGRGLFKITSIDINGKNQQNIHLDDPEQLYKDLEDALA